MAEAQALKGPRRLVLDVLERSDTPLGAYEILGKLARAGVKGPPTVYRALKKLVADGKIHRIESLNAFVACHGKHHTGEPNAFAVCLSCRGVQEIHDCRFNTLIQAVTVAHRFRVKQETLELMGECGRCGGKRKKE